ncbi:hypothetical protein [Cupriavidus metallidurans]|uniref:hypothetical protein n=1 Tax=Cupriavidus metallidurans TaxID=119219 RepID=UPI003D74A483
MHLYSAARDQQATAAKAAFDKLELQKDIDTERGNLDKLLAAELGMQDRLAQGYRDFTLRAMLDKTTKAGLIDPLDKRITFLAGSADLLREAQNTAVAQEGADNALAILKEQIARYPVDTPSCDDLLKTERGTLPQSISIQISKLDVVGQRVVTDFLDKSIRDYCVGTKARAEPYTTLKGQIQTARVRYESDLADLNAKKQEAQAFKQEFDVAQAELDKSMAKTLANPEALPGVQAAAKKFQDALDKLKAIKGVVNIDQVNNPFLAQFLAEKRIESLESFLSAVTEYQLGGELPASASKAVVISTLLPQLVDQSKIALTQANKPLVTPYVLARNYHQLNLEAANRDIAASEAIVRHSKDIVDVLYLQASQLLLAQNELNVKVNGAPISVAAKYANRPFMRALSTANSKEKQQLYSATARYLDTANRLDAKRYKLEYVRIADFHARSLAYAEVNTKQWESLIGNSIAQLQEFGGGGWKPEQAVGLLNTLMLFWIGLRV